MSWSSRIFSKPAALIATIALVVGAFVATADVAKADTTGSALSQSVVASGSKVDLRTTLPFVSSVDDQTQELVQTIDPAKVRITGPSDVIAPTGWTVTFSTDGGGSYQTVPTSWAAVNRIKATGPVNGGGMSGQDAQIISKTNVVAMSPSVLSASGTAGDGWDVTFDDRGYVYNIYHHGSPSSLDCHVRATGSTCPGWAAGGVTLPYTTNSEAASYVDNKNRHVWIPANSSTSVGFECVDVSNVTAPVLCPTSYTPVASGFTGLGTYNEFDQLAYSKGYLFSIAHTNGRMYCLNIAANNGFGAACPALPTFSRVAAVGWAQATPDAGLVAWGSRIYGYSNKIAYCLDVATWSTCAGWSALERGISTTNPKRMYLEPTADKKIGAVCYNPVNVCITADGTSRAEIPGVKAALIAGTGSAQIYGTTETTGTKLVYSDGWGGVYCYDVKISAYCANWNQTNGISLVTLGTVYAVRIDATNPNCAWTNEDSRYIRSIDITTGTAGCATPSPTATFDGSISVPQMTCDGTNSVKGWRSFTLGNVEAGVDYSTATLTIKDAAGNVVESNGTRYEQFPMTISGTQSIADLSGLNPADAGRAPTFIVNFDGRVSTKAAAGTVSLVSAAAQVCMTLTTVVTCSPSTVYSALPDGLTGFSASIATISSAGVRSVVSATSSNLTISAATPDQCGGEVKGQAIDAATNLGIPGLVGTLTNSSGTAINDSAGRPITATTDASGNYTFGSVAPGTYKVAFSDVAGPTLSPNGADVSGVRINGAAYTLLAVTYGAANIKTSTSGAFTVVAGTPTAVDWAYSVSLRTTDDVPKVGQGVATTINVATNDILSNGTATVSSIKLCGTAVPTNVATDCATTRTIDATQGVYSISGTNIVFTPAAAFTGAATGIYYYVTDSAGQTGLAKVTPTVYAAPTVVNDTVVGDAIAKPSIDPLANDSAASGTTLDATSLKICAAATLDSAACAGTTVASTGGSFAITNGQIVFTPTAGFIGTDSVRYVVADALGSARRATVSVRVIGVGPSITTSTLPVYGMGSGAYSQSLTGTAGTATLTGVKWSATGLPPGLTLNTTSGAITGTPTTPGTYNIVVTLTDTAGRTDTKTITQLVGTPPTITNLQTVGAYDANLRPYMPWTVVNNSVSYQMTASAGTFPLQTTNGWTISSSRLTTSNFEINANSGLLTARPTTANWNWIIVTVTDSVGLSSSVTVMLPSNAGPSVTLADQTNNLGASVSVAPVAGGSFAPQLNGAWSATGLPTGLSIDPNTGVVSGTVTTAGVYSVNITLVDLNGMSVVKPVTWTVNAPPVITQASFPTLGLNQTLGAAGAPSTIALAATTGTGALKASAAWTATGLPAGLTLNTTTGVISGTPTAAGTSSVVLTVTDVNGLVATKTLQLVVAAAPVITTLAEQPAASLGQAITPITETYSLGTGALPATRAWSATGLPLGMLLDPNTGAISGTPTRAGSYDVVVTVTDVYGLKSSKTITIPVYAPPVISTPATLPNLTKGSAVSGLSIAVVPGTGDLTTTLTPNSVSGGSWNITTGNLPTGLTMAVATGVITGTPTVAGTYQFTVRVTDTMGMTALKNFTVFVGALPTLTGTATLDQDTTAAGVQALVVGTAMPPFTPAFTAGDAPIPATGAWSATGLPAGVTINPDTGVISGTPTAVTSPNPASIVITVRDSQGNTASRTITAKVLQAPTITTADITIPVNVAIPNTNATLPQTYVLGTASALKLSTWTATGLPAGLSINAASGYLWGTPTALGSFNVSVSVTDNNTDADGTAHNLTTTKVIKVDVVSPPTITTIPTATITGATSVQSGSVYVQTFTTAAAHRLRVGDYVTVTGMTPSGYNVANLPVASVPSPTQFVVNNTTTAAAFATGGTATLSGYKVNALGAAMNPVTQTVSAGTGALKATGGWSVVSVTKAGSAVTSIPGVWVNPNTGDIMGNPVETGWFVLTLKVTDTNGLSDTETYAIGVANAPTITTATPVTSSPNYLVVGNPVGTAPSPAITLAATAGTNALLANTVDQWSATGLPAGLSLNAKTGAITGTPTTTGDYSVAVSIVDSVGLVTTKNILFSVLAKPSFTSDTNLGNAGLRVATSIPVIAAQGTATLRTTGGFACPVTCGLPAGLTLNADTGVISGIPTTAGTSTFSLTVTDSVGLVATKSFSITVAAAAPTITSASALPSQLVGQAMTPFTPVVSAGTAALKTTGGWSATGLPNGLSINPDTGVISGTPTASASATPLTFSVTVTDTAGLSATKNFSLVIASAPAITTAAAINDSAHPYMTGVAIAPVTLAATPGTAAISSWAVATGTLPTGLSLASATGILTGTPATGTAGSYSIGIKVTNAAGLSDTRTFTFVVVAPPTITNAATLAPFVPGTAITPVDFDATPGTAAIPTTGTVWSVGAPTVMPAGLTLNPVTGVVSGTPTTVGPFSFDIVVTDAAGITARKTITGAVANPPVMTVPNGHIYASINHLMTPYALPVTAGTAPLGTTGVVFSSSPLPAGLSLNPITGVISGTPTVEGTTAVTFTVTDSIGLTDTDVVDVVVGRAEPMITSPEVPSTFAALALGSPVSSVSMTASPGFVPIGAPGTVWALDPITPLPLGVTLNAQTGALSGTPIAAGKYQLEVTLTDAAGLSDTATLLLIVSPSPVVTTANIPLIVSGVAMTPVTNTARAGGAAIPATGAWSSTDLPAGLTLNPDTGVISGTPTIAPSVTPVVWHVAVTDRYGVKGVKEFSTQVGGAPVISTSTIPNVTVGAEMTPFTLAATPVAPAVIPASGNVWSVDPATPLPAGLSLDPVTGTLTGTPTVTAATYPVNFRVTDSLGTVTTKSISLVAVNAPPTITSGATLKPATAASVYSVPLAATAGTFPIRSTGAWAVTGNNALPAGLTLNPDTGVISGTPAAAGTSTFSVTVTDTNGLTDTINLSLTVVAAGVNKTVLSLPRSVASGLAVTAQTFDMATAGSSSAGLPVTYKVTNENVCYVDGSNKLNILAVGTCEITASSGTGTLLSTDTKSFAVTRAVQTMTVTRPGTAIRGTSPVQMAAAATDNPAGFLLNASTSSGLSPVYTVAPVVVNGVTQDPICSVDDSGIVTWLYDLTLTPSQPGYNANGAKCLVTVSQPGDANFAPVADQVIEITATHEANPVLPPGGVVATKSPAVKMSRKGGTFVGSLDSLTITITKTSITLKPASNGGYIGAIKATITIPYKVLVNGVLTDKSQVCVINYGQLTKMKATDPMAFKKKSFTTTKTCVANADAFKFFTAGNSLSNVTNQVERDRRFSTTFLKLEGLTGKGKPIFPTKRLYTFNIG